jgi:hypothetical protein
MIEFTSMWKGATDRGVWAARRASFVAKAKATKAVWFPPDPQGSGKKAASTAKKATKKTTGRTTKKATGAARKTTSAAKT